MTDRTTTRVAGDPERVRALLEQRHAIELELAELMPEADGVIDPTSAMPLLLQQAQADLAESQARYERLASRMSAIVFEADVGGGVVYANPAVARVTGYTLDELRDERWHDRLFPGELAAQPVEIGKRLELGDVTAHEITIRARDGSEHILELTTANRYAADGHLQRIVGIVTDITDRRRMEAELLKVQKLEALGGLAGGIAHDFNNLLTAILGNVSLARLRGEMGAEAERYLKSAEVAISQATKLTGQLLTFARGGAPVRELTPLAPLIYDTAEMILRSTRLAPTYRLPDGLWAEIDSGQIGQVLTNLLVNADQATPEGGTVEIYAEEVVLPEQNGTPLPAGPYIRIGVRDEGIGISPEHLPRIFDPFFTTKQRGSGIGLAAAHSIVRKHGGHISAESVLGEGTHVYFYLPASSAQAAAGPASAEPLLRGHGRILLMDDEALVRRIGEDMLRFLGYEAECTVNGEEALVRYTRALAEGRPFAAVILDLIVQGGMGGEETAERLLAIDPDVRAIVSSGYSSDDVLANYAQYGFCAMLPKPFKLQALARALREVVG